MNKNRITILSLLFLLLAMPLQARKQWTEKQAWAWEKKVGVIKGFNAPVGAYPGMTTAECLEKAHKLGYNSYRIWVGGKAEDVVKNLENMAKEAEKYDMTISPVLCVPIPQSYWDSKGTDEAALKSMKEYVQTVIGGVAKNERVILWDLCNEPGCGANFMQGSDNTFIYFCKAIVKFAEWAYEMNPTQAISSSIFWRGDLVRHKTEAHKIAWETEALMDVHNFHNYGCAGNSGDQGKSVQEEIDCLKKIGNRPLICTECLTRLNNSGLNRTFAIFAKNNVHFYQWGFYSGEANWTVSWNRTAYDPYDEEFHNLLRPNDEPIDDRDIDLIRNYKFTNGVSTDEGAEYTDKWESKRAWRWMAIGPVKGKVQESVMEALKWLGSPESGKGYNSLNVKLSYDEYKADHNAFFAMADALLARANDKGMTVLFTLLSDEDLQATDEELAKYEAQVLRRYYTDKRIQAWDLYYHPGEKATDKARLENLVKLLFRYARYEFPNQPVMATPMLKVKPFKDDFNYREALYHGRWGGWSLFEYEGGSTAELCALIWKLSDVIAFSSNQSAGQTGWIKSVAFRYARPIFCTQWEPIDDKNATETLDNFSRSHTYWYQKGSQPALNNLWKFEFQPIVTNH